MITQKAFFGPKSRVYFYDRYDWTSMIEAKELIEESGVVESSEFNILFKTKNTKVYEIDNDSVIMSDGSCAYLFTNEAFSVWMIVTDTIDNILTRLSKDIIISNRIVAKRIPSLIGKLLIDSAKLIENSSNENREVYHTLSHGILLPNDHNEYFLFSNLKECKEGQKLLAMGEGFVAL